MATWENTKIIPPVRIDVQPGVNPSQYNVMVPIDTFVGNNATTIVLKDGTEIKELYPITVKEQNVNKKIVTLVDQRYFWNWNLIYTVKNKTRNRGAVYNVTDYTNNNYRAPVFQENTIEVDTQGNQQAFTAYQILINYLFEDVMELGEGTDYIIDNGVEDNGYPYLNYEKMGVPLSKCIAELLDYADLDIQILFDGKIRIYNAKSDAELEASSGYFKDKKSIGELARKTPNLQKPKTVFIRVPKIQEIEYSFADQGSSADAETVVNVTRMQYTLSGTNRQGENKTFVRNGYYPIHEVIEVIGNAQFEVGYVNVTPDDEKIVTEEQIKGKVVQKVTLKPTKTFTYTEFKEAFYLPGLFRKLVYDNYLLQTGGVKDIVMQSLMVTISNDYRTLYQLSSAARNEIYMMSTSIGNPLNASGGERTPAPVFCDYSAWYKLPNTDQITLNNVNPRVVNFEYPKTVGERKGAGNQAPFTVQIENEDLGLIRVNAGTDKRFQYEKFQLTKWETFPTWGNYVNGVPFEGATPDPDFSLSFILSVIKFDELYVEPADDPNEYLSFDLDGENCVDIEYYFDYKEIPAIFSWKYAGWYNGILLNNIKENIIRPQIESAFQDNMTGIHEVGGIDTSDGKLPGYCRSIIIQETPKRISTTYVFNQPRPKKSNWKGLFSDAKRLIFKNNIFTDSNWRI